MNGLEGYADLLATIGLATVRLLTLAVVVPFLGAAFITGLARNALVLALATPLFFPLLEATPPQLEAVDWIFLALKEAVIGLILGLLASLVFWAMESLGSLIDMQTGSSMATTFNPFTTEQSSVSSSLYLQLAIILFFVSGAFQAFLGMIYDSYLVWPPFAALPEPTLPVATLFISFLNHLFDIIFLFAAPILITLFLAEFGLGMMNRFAPQLNVFFLAMPVKSMLALFILTLYLAYLALYIKDDFSQQRLWFQELGNLFAR